jgi:hypothetical protein
VNGLDIQPFTKCMIQFWGVTPVTGDCAIGDMNGDGDLDGYGESTDHGCFINMLLFQFNPCLGCGTPVMTNCNDNDAPDFVDIATGASPDCDGNGVPDECQISTSSTAPGGPWYCASGCDADVNNNGWLDVCEVDCDGDGLPDSYEIAQGAADCNANGVPDACEQSNDCNGNGVPDDCDVDPADPDGNSQTSPDCNSNGIPDSCDLSRSMLPSFDCNSNSVPDECDIASAYSQDTNANGIPDECEGEGLMGGGNAPEGFGGEPDPDASWSSFWEWYAEALTTPNENGKTLDQLSSADRFHAIMDKLVEVGLPYARPW